MKKTLLCLTLFSGALFSYGQIGINTESPQALLHLKGIISDVVITTDGNMGIGTTNPSVKLEINTGGTSVSPIAGFKLNDGSQGLGRVLVKDAGSDEAYWDTPINTYLRLPGFQTQKNYSIGTTYFDTGYSITFPAAGVYWVTLGIYIGDSRSNQKTHMIKLMPTNNIVDWDSASEYYEGGSEVGASNLGEVYDPRIYYSQLLSIPSDKLKAYVMMKIDSTVAGYINFAIGYNAYPSRPQRTGGAYIRVL